MKRDDPRLVDYLAGELAQDQSDAVEAAMRRDPALRAHVEDLRALEARLRAEVPDLAAADEAVASLPLRAPGPHPLARLTRYAAVILLGFAIGFWTRGLGSAAAGPDARPSATPVARVGAIDGGTGFAQFANSYHEVSQQRPQMSALGRGLLALSQR